ncbi:hypothetical protein JI664_22870 [Rhodobacter sp. NTK016B]|uniref:hypothetical protein n=1 Tax=Rhodobacter sp. NTK016B TaxID=2759676 RepID=UPI001A8FF7C3|nr:hypothetical protein [Rhodobacter sp. NTK016B]MBN8294832.1 hypothetical protein [Rhodobacter sp. NTK016B]
MLRSCLSLLVPVALIATAASAHDLPGPRPFAQMRGDCSAFAMDVSQEAALWADAPTATVSASARASAARSVAPGVLASLTLRPQGEVSFPVPPGQDRNGPDRFAGHVTVTIPESGLWRVAASNSLWFDAVSEGAILETGAFEMQTGCATPFKVVVFDLQAGEVALQFNGSPTEHVEIAVLPWTAH